MVHHWKSLDLEITDYNYRNDRHNQVKLYHLKSQTLKQVEIMNVSNKPTQDTSLEMF